MQEDGPRKGGEGKRSRGDSPHGATLGLASAHTSSPPRGAAWGPRGPPIGTSRPVAHAQAQRGAPTRALRPRSSPRWPCRPALHGGSACPHPWRPATAPPARSPSHPLPAICAFLEHSPCTEGSRSDLESGRAGSSAQLCVPGVSDFRPGNRGGEEAGQAVRGAPGFPGGAGAGLSGQPIS